MSRKVFFSFHFKRDAWRAGQIRNSDLLADEDEYGVIDSVEWEKLEREGDEAIKRWINDQLKHTSVTVVLIGAQTAERDWVDYEIRRSWERGNALVGLRVHNVKDQDRKTDIAGSNPLDHIRLKDGKALSSIFKTYDWVTDDGRTNLGEWVEEAFQTRAAYDGETRLDDSDVDKSVPPAPRPPYGTGPTIIRNPSGPWAR
jgi:hypothetical protein